MSRPTQSRRRRARRARAVPAEEVHVLGVLDDAASHHDGLEVLPVDGPELDVSQRCKSRAGRAEVTQRTQIFTTNGADRWKPAGLFEGTGI